MTETQKAIEITKAHPQGCSCGSPECPQLQADMIGVPYDPEQYIEQATQRDCEGEYSDHDHDRSFEGGTFSLAQQPGFDPRRAPDSGAPDRRRRNPKPHSQS